LSEYFTSELLLESGGSCYFDQKNRLSLIALQRGSAFFLKQKKAAMVAAFETISHMLGK
jgi:hypothetical protein